MAHPTYIVSRPEYVITVKGGLHSPTSPTEEAESWFPVDFDGSPTISARYQHSELGLPELRRQAPSWGHCTLEE